MSLVKEIANYSARPFFTTRRDRFTPAYLLKLTLITVGLAFLAIIIVSILFGLAGIEFPEQSEVFEETPPSQLLFYAVILAPLLEETFFRSWLGSRNSIRIAMPIVMAIFLFFLFIGFSSPLTMPVLLILGAGLAFYYAVLQQRFDDRMIDTNFKYFFWGSTIIFGLIHLGNYNMDGFNPALALLVLPQTIAGFVFGYTRMRFGVLACMLTHGFYNGAIFFIVDMFS